MIEVKVKRDEDSSGVTFQLDLPDNLAGLVEKYGEDVVYNNARSQLVVAFQGGVRERLKKGETLENIQKTYVDTWKPGIRRPGKSKAEKMREDISSMSKEERQAILAQLRESR